MSSAHRLPEPPEINAIWKLHDLALALEEFFGKGRFRKPHDTENMIGPEPSHRMAEWRVGVHKAIYRSFISGAALADIYKAVYVAAMERRDLQPSNIRDPLVEGQARDAFFSSFSVFRDPMTEMDEEEAFGVYGQWLLRELRSDEESNAAMEKRFSTGFGRALCCRQRQQKEPGQNCPIQLTAEGDHAEAHAVALDLMRLFWACSEVFRGLITGRALFNEQSQTAVNGQYALVVPFAWFSSWMVGLCPEQGRIMCPLHIRPPVRVGGEVGANSWITSRLFAPPGGRPLGFGDAPEAWIPPVYSRFFVYFLRKHMSLAFHSDFFQPDHHLMDTTHNWTSFIRSIFIFALDDIEGREAGPPDGFIDSGDLLVSYESNGQ